MQGGETVALRPGGEEEDVTDANKAEYVRLYANHILLGGAKRAAMDALLKGWQMLVPEPVRSLLRQQVRTAHPLKAHHRA